MGVIEKTPTAQDDAFFKDIDSEVSDKGFVVRPKTCSTGRGRVRSGR